MPKHRKAGIHLHKTKVIGILDKHRTEYYWILVARNGKTIARSSETYKRKAGAVKSIRIAANIFYQAEGAIGVIFFDHSTGKPINDFVPF